MSLMARVLSWNLFRSRNSWNHFGTCLYLLLPFVYSQGDLGNVPMHIWLLILSGPVSYGCVTGAHYIIKSVKRLVCWPPPEFLKLSEEMVRSIHTLVNGSDMRLNKRQCLDLSSKLSRTIQNIQELSNQCKFSNGVLEPSLKRLYQVLIKAKLLVNDCSNENWITTSVFQIQNESAFQVILMDVGFCYHKIYEQAKLSMSGEGKNVELEDLRDSSIFKPASVKDVDEDREELQERLKNLVDERNYAGWLFQVYYFLLVRLSKKLRLAAYLLVKLDWIAEQPREDGLQLFKKLIWEEESYSSMTWGHKIPLGAGSGASGVCKTKWLSIPCAKKCNIPEPYFSKEAGILSHVNYPNIIKFICCGEKSKLVEDFIALELMEMSLSDLIKKKGKKGIPFSNDAAVDIMAQIGRGMCYLHGLRVAHRDLKPANVVLNVLTSPHLEDTYHVKLVDFGTSKTQVDPMKTTSTEHGFGTTTHKAPEVRDLAPPKSEGDRKWRAVWFKADVWSFAIICLEVLSLELRKSRDQDLNSMFPPHCPEVLAALLKDCLQANPRARPNFLKVCSRLEALRHSLSRRLPTSDQDSLSEISTYCSHNQFIKVRLKEHFQRQNAGVVVDDDKEEVLIPQASHAEPRAYQEVFRMDQASSSTTNEDRDLEIWTKEPRNEVFRKALARQRMDQASSSTTNEDRDLEIWTKQPGNEVFRKAVEKWREECKMITERIRMTEQQQLAVIDQLFFTRKLHTQFVCLLNWVIHITRAEGISICWTCSPMLLEGLINLCWTIYKYRCLWRLFMVAHSDINKLMVFNNRFDMLNQKRDFFSFEDDAKDYDPSSSSPPKLTGLLLDCVQDVFWGLLLIMGFSYLYLLDVKKYDLLKQTWLLLHVIEYEPPKLIRLLLGYANEAFLEFLLNIGSLNFYLHNSPSSKLTWLLIWMLAWMLTWLFLYYLGR